MPPAIGSACSADLFDHVEGPTHQVADGVSEPWGGGGESRPRWRPCAGSEEVQQLWMSPFPGSKPAALNPDPLCPLFGLRWDQKVCATLERDVGAG